MVNLPDKIFKAKWNPNLVHQVVVAEFSNRRGPIAHTKDRSEVRGGGRKPWRQKGTGLARVGSIRSPIWRGGGITFGPRKERNFVKKVNKKMKRAALFSVLSKKFADGEIGVVDSFTLKNWKTKEAKELVKKFLGKKTGSVLCVPAEENKRFALASKNIENVGAISAKSLNVADCLLYKFIVFEKGSVNELTDHLNL